MPEIKLSKLKPNPANPRLIKDERFAKLCKSLQDFPRMMELRPIVVDDSMVILGGNMRYKALLHLGYKSIPDSWVMKAAELTEEQKKEFIIKDNVGFGENDWDMLANEWDAMQLEEWGLELPVNFGADGVEEDGFDAEPPLNPITKLGDIYELNQHRVQCGDSTDGEVVGKLMNGGKATIAFTSPPYNKGVQKELKNHSQKLKGQLYIGDNTDDKDEIEYVKFLSDFTSLSMGFAQYSFVNIAQLAGNKIAVIEYLHQLREHFVDRIVWVKSNGQPAMAKNVMNSCFEDIFIFKNDSRPKRTIGTGQFRGTVKNIYSSPSQGGNEYSEKHAATFPLAFVAYFIETFTSIGGSVLDLFLGSGTTLIAADQLNRACYGQEIDPAYCDIIIARWIKHRQSRTPSNGTAKPDSIKRNGKELSAQEIEAILNQIDKPDES